MARRRKGLIEILAPDLHRSYRKAKHDMRPDRAIGRVLSLPELRAGLRSVMRPKTKMSPQARQKQIAAMQRKAAKPAPTKKTAAKKTTAVRKKDGSGQFDGSKTMNSRDLAAWQRANGGYVDPLLLPRSARTRKRP